jgi:hypothetical protein
MHPKWWSRSVRLLPLRIKPHGEKKVAWIDITILRFRRETRALRFLQRVRGAEHMFRRSVSFMVWTVAASTYMEGRAAPSPDPVDRK